MKRLKIEAWGWFQELSAAKARPGISENERRRIAYIQYGLALPYGVLLSAAWVGLVFLSLVMGAIGALLSSIG